MILWILDPGCEVLLGLLSKLWLVSVCRAGFVSRRVAARFLCSPYGAPRSLLVHDVSWPCELPCSFSGAIWNQLMPCLSLLFYLQPSHPVHFLWCALLAPGCIWLWFSAGHPPAALDALLYFGNPCVSAPICRFILVGSAGFAVILLGM